MENKIEMNGRKREEEINSFLTEYATFKEAAAKQLGNNEEAIASRYQIFLSAGSRNLSSSGFRKPQWADQPASEKQKALIRKLVEKKRLQLDLGSAGSIDTITKGQASRVLDRVFGRRA